jgi:transposase
MTRRYALRDDQWERIKDLLPGRKETVGVTAKDNRLFVEAVLYRYPCRHSLAGLTRKIRRFSSSSYPLQSVGEAGSVATGV